LYWIANQALWRVDRTKQKGFGRDVCVGLDASSGSRNNMLLTGGVRFNEPLPVHIHNTMSLVMCETSLSPQFLPRSILEF
jgi:porin